MYEISPVYEDVVARLTARGVERYFDVVEGEVPAGEDVKRMPDGTVKPVAVILAGVPDTHPRGIHITSIRDAAGIWDVSVMCLAADNLGAVRLMDQVRQAWLGYQPPGCSEMEEIGGTARSPVDSYVPPYRYRISIGFVVTIDGNVLS